MGFLVHANLSSGVRPICYFFFRFFSPGVVFSHTCGKCVCTGGKGMIVQGSEQQDARREQVALVQDPLPHARAAQPTTHGRMLQIHTE